MKRTRLDDVRAESPRIDDRALTSPIGGLLPGEYDALRWYGVRANGTAAQAWDAGDLSAGEPVFVPVPGTRGSERGCWLTFATDRTGNTSWLLVIPARDPARGPVARVRIPVRIPLGLHGTWLPTEE